MASGFLKCFLLILEGKVLVGFWRFGLGSGSVQFGFATLIFLFAFKLKIKMPAEKARFTDDYNLIWRRISKTREC